MATTQSAQHLLRPREEPDLGEPEVVEADVAYPRIDAMPRERDARAEIERLRAEIERLVHVDGGTRARDAVDSALGSMARLQVVTANVDACHPPPADLIGSAFVALADARLKGHPDAIERGMTYTADNQMRLLQNP